MHQEYRCSLESPVERMIQDMEWGTHDGFETDPFPGTSSYQRTKKFRPSRKGMQAIDVLKKSKEDLRSRAMLYFVVFTVMLLSLVSWSSLKPQLTRFLQMKQSEQLFHYIVVGGGPSGVIVATELARLFPNLQVLLLESGTGSQASVLRATETAHTSVLRLGGNLLQNAVPREASTSAMTRMSNRADATTWINEFDVPIFWSGLAREAGNHWSMNEGALIGRGLGGSGLINAMIYVRSLASDWERWNVTGWSWSDVLPHYEALETYVLASDNKKHYRGSSGPIHTTAPESNDEIGRLFVEAAMNAGIPKRESGFNTGETRVGAGFYEFNIRDGIRDSVAHALLRDIPANLHVQSGCTVTRVLFREQQPDHSRGTVSQMPVRTIGVEYVDVQNGSQSKLSSSTVLRRALLSPNDPSSNVILAAGALLTPQVLANSGIRPDGGVVDLPHPFRVQDHPVVAMSFTLDSALAAQGPSLFNLADQFSQYLRRVKSRHDSNQPHFHSLDASTGAVGAPGFSAGAFLRSPWANGDAPDIQLTVFPRAMEPHVEMEGNHKNSDMLVTIALLQPEAYWDIKPSTSKSSLFPLSDLLSMSEHDRRLVQKYSLPTLSLPELSSHLLSEKDVSVLVWGIEQVRNITSASPLADSLFGEELPGSSLRGEPLREYVNQNVLTNSHWVGSTQMGDNPSWSVVDERLVVRGTSSLRVVDAGVLPGPPNGNTHSTVCVVARHAARLMAEERNMIP